MFGVLMPESYTHLDTKSDIYWNIVQEGTYAEVEKSVGRTRTDVLTQVGEHVLAIEVQHTPIPMKSIIHRMHQHTLAGYHTLWLFTQELLNVRDEQYAHNYKWVLFIQMLQDGMIFMPTNNTQIIPARLDNSLRWNGDSLIAGRKIIEKKDPISLDDLSFDTNYGYNITTCKTVKWTIYTGD